MAAATAATTASAAAVNPLLSCGLCSGYLRDPHTFCECLHTCAYRHVQAVLQVPHNSHAHAADCKVCLVRHMFAQGASCPECRVELHCDPLATGAVKCVRQRGAHAPPAVATRHAPSQGGPDAAGGD